MDYEELDAELNAVNVLGLTALNRSELRPGMFDALKFKSTDTTDLKDQAQLHKRALEYVHINSIEGYPVSVARLNRQFGRIARKLNCSAREVADKLVVAGKLVVLARGAKIGLMSKASWDTAPELFALQGIEVGTNEHDQLLELWASRTL